MMPSLIHNYFYNQQEPIKSCLLFLRKYILEFEPDITEKWSYGMPFYCFRGKRFCYLWVDKKSKQPYIGIVDGNKINFPHLIQDDRKRMKIFLVDATQDVPMQNIDELLQMVLKLCK